MTYNIDRFKIREMENFRIEDCTEEYIDEIIERFLDNDEGDFEGRYLKNEKLFKIEKIHYQGMGSGWGYSEFKEFLGKTKGHLKALVIWESGEDVGYLTVNDGKVEWEDL